MAPVPSPLALHTPLLAPTLHSMTTAKTKAAPSETVRALEAKWTKPLIAAGFTAMPDVIFRKQKALKLKHIDVLVLLHLASFWWNAAQNPWPSKATIADALDVDPRTVQRSIAKMEKLGYVTRLIRKASVGDNLTNEYDLRGLAAAAAPLAAEELALRAKRVAEDKKRTTTPTLAVIEGGKQP